MNLGGPPRRASEPTRRPASGHVHDNESVAETQQSGETNAASGDATEEDDNQTQASAASVPALNEGTRLTVLAGLACVFLIAATFSARNWSKYEVRHTSLSCFASLARLGFFGGDTLLRFGPY